MAMSPNPGPQLGAGTPRLTCVLICAHAYPLIARTIAHLRRQTIAADIELLIFCPSPSQLKLPPHVDDGFQAVRVLNLSLIHISEPTRPY